MNRAARSLLFVPGDRPERFQKAMVSGAHQVILDLEDAVAPDNKNEARAQVASWLAAGNQALVRINAADTKWHLDDVDMLCSQPCGGVMLSKADHATLLGVASAVSTQRHIIALLETVSGYMQLEQLCAVPGLDQIAFGSIDFSLDSGIADEGDALTSVRVQIALASRHAGLAPPIDGVSTELNDDARMRAHALRSRQLGFGGKLCIHPRQVAAVNAAFLPSAAETEWARAVLDAFEASAGAATTLNGKMIDKPVVDHARRILSG